MSKFQSSQSIGEIVTIMPKASDIFKEYQIDFCCGGHRPLIDAIRKQNLEEELIINRLNNTYDEMKEQLHSVDFYSMKSSLLIDYVVNTHHSYLGITLPEISELTLTLLRVHGGNHKEMFDIHRLYHQLKAELEQHLLKEELVLFPMIKTYEENPSEGLLKQISETLQETEAEHEGAGDILKELRRITDDYTVPADGCKTYERTFHKLEELEGDLFQHIHLENNILFLRYDVTNLV